MSTSLRPWIEALRGGPPRPVSDRLIHTNEPLECSLVTASLMYNLEFGAFQDTSCPAPAHVHPVEDLLFSNYRWCNACELTDLTFPGLDFPYSPNYDTNLRTLFSLAQANLVKTQSRHCGHRRGAAFLPRIYYPSVGSLRFEKPEIPISHSAREI